MRVAMYYANNDVRVEEMQTPKPGRGEVLVRIESSGICGSDVMQWYRAGRTPLVLGHEIAGSVAEVGEGVTTVREGDRISASHHVPCNTCRYCLDGHHTACDTLRRTNFHPGGFAEYVLLPSINVDRGIYLLPDEVTFDEGTFIEPIACIYRGQKAARVGLGKSILVIGSGISGLLHIRLAIALGAASVAATDINEYRLEAARQSGASLVIDARDDVSATFRDANGGRGADAVILTTGAHGAINQAFDSVDRGGTVLFFAPSAEGAEVTLPVNKLFWKNEITLTSSYAADYGEHMAAMEMIRSRRVKVSDLITHRLPLERTQEGFGLVASAGESIKVIIRPHEYNSTER